MNSPGSKRVKANRRPNFQVTEKEVFKIEINPIVKVDKEETLDIDLDCRSGFTVFIPFGGLFEEVDGSDQIFEAFEVNPIDVSEDFEDKLWRVRIVRKNVDNPGLKVFAYCIYSHDLDNFAVAGSPPKMNLDP